eukprot:g2587.t1
MEGKSTLEWPTSPEGYQLIKKIGQGAFAKVYVAHCEATNCDVAVKVMDLEKVTSNLDHLRQEVMTMKLCRHKNVLPLHTSFNVKRELWLVMPYMDKGSMLEAMRQLKQAGKSAELDEEWIATVLKEVCQGLEYLHSSGWVHRDIKAGNILLNSKAEVMLADFGVAGILTNPDPINQENNRNTFVGTPCWMAPEVMKQSAGYTEKADIWSLGITALELAKTYAPYAKERTMKVLLRTLQDPPPSLKTYAEYGDRGKAAKDFKQSFKDFYAACLVKDPKKRCSATQLLKKTFVKRSGEPATVLKELIDSLPSLGSEVVSTTDAVAATAAVASPRAGDPPSAPTAGADSSSSVGNGSSESAQQQIGGGQSNMPPPMSVDVPESQKAETEQALDSELMMMWKDPDKTEGNQCFTVSKAKLQEQIEMAKEEEEKKKAQATKGSAAMSTQSKKAPKKDHDLLNEAGFEAAFKEIDIGDDDEDE